jgi:hypothetical protein
MDARQRAYGLSGLLLAQLFHQDQKVAQHLAHRPFLAVHVAVAARLTKEAVKLNATVGDPTSIVKPKAKKAGRGRGRRRSPH